VRIVELLEEAVGLDADLAVGRMHAAHGEVGLDLGRDPVDDLDRKEVGPVDALIALGRDSLPRLRSANGVAGVHPAGLDFTTV
jgi:hypothetical protein